MIRNRILISPKECSQSVVRALQKGESETHGVFIHRLPVGVVSQ